MPNPTYAKVQERAKVPREKQDDFILAVGGVSVIDCCKIISAQAKLDENIFDYEYIAKNAQQMALKWGRLLRNGC